MGYKKIILILTISIFILILSGCGTEKNKFGPYGSTHDHADFKVYVLGKSLNFNSPQYQVMDRLTHVENRDGDILHVHATRMTLGFFLQTLGIKLTPECITLDTGNKHCSDGRAELKVFVRSAVMDWEEIFYPEDYIMQDLDKILVTYGTEDEEGIKKQLDSVTDKAKIT